MILVTDASFQNSDDGGQGRQVLCLKRLLWQVQSHKLARIVRTTLAGQIIAMVE